MKPIAIALACTLALSATFASAAPITVTDDQGQTLTLPAPAKRVISLAPHVTELIYAAGGGSRLIAADANSNYPAAAQALPRVGSFRGIDIERVLAAKPDLLIVWLHGPAEKQLAQLRALGIPMYYSEPKHLADIPASLRKLGTLLGSSAVAEQSARRFDSELAALRRQYAGKPKLRVFYQVWHKPLYTLSGQHIVNDAIELCGGQNIFAQLPIPAPVVSEEAVIAANPQVMLAAGMKKQDDLQARWAGINAIAAVQYKQQYQIDSDILNRPTPRFLEGTRAVCRSLDAARAVYAKVSP